MGLGGGQCATAFDQFRTLEIQRLRQQLADRSRLGDELIDLRDFRGRQLAPTLGRRTSSTPLNSTLISATLKPTCLAKRTIASRSSTRSSYCRRPLTRAALGRRPSLS